MNSCPKCDGRKRVAQFMCDTCWDGPPGRKHRGLSEALEDPIDPQHYTKHPSGIDCIAITEHMNFNLGNATKYIWRAGLKGEALEDLKKAAWYIAREISRLEKEPSGG